MKRLVVLTAAMVAVTGCGTSSSADADDVDESAFIAYISSFDPPGTDQALLDTGYLLCDELDRGTSIEHIADSMLDAGYEAAAGAAILTGAVSELCPSHASTVMEFGG